MTRERIRAAQYAVCAWSLRNDHETDGAAAIFDQALSNGLAAIVAHHWPGEEVWSGGRVKSAADLLGVIEEQGLAREGDVWLIPHGDPDKLWIEMPLVGGLFEESDGEPPRMANFTEVRVGVLREAIGKTQAVRHAREDADTVSLSSADVQALEKLDYNPALFALTEEMIDRAEDGAAKERFEEAARAEEYWESLEDDEKQRRRAGDYGFYATIDPTDEAPALQDCPICECHAFVAESFDSQTGEIGIGRCVACSFRRSEEVADDEGLGLLLRRVAEDGR